MPRSLSVLLLGLSLVVLSGMRAHSAEAAPKGYALAGSYHGDVPGSLLSDWAEISVSGGGKVKGTLRAQGSGGADTGIPSPSGSIAGKITRDGTLELSGTEVYYVSIGFIPVVHPFTATATVELNADGDLVGVASDGTAFVWRRK